MDDDSTSPEVVRALLRAWRPKNRSVWDPACGGGNLARELKRAGYAVVSSDIAEISYGHAGVDFLATKHRGADCLIVDPPADLAVKFVEHAIRLGVLEMAMVMPRSLWEPRHPILKRLKPSIVMPFSAHDMWVVWSPGSGDTVYRPLPGADQTKK